MISPLSLFNLGTSVALKLIERQNILKILTVFYEKVRNNDLLMNSFHILSSGFDGHVEHISDF